MKTKLLLAATAVAALFVAGCETPLPPGAEPGPNGTMAFDVLIEASSPGVRIEANGDSIGEAPVHMKVFGDRDGTFHNFNSDYFVVQAVPSATNQYAQTRVFRTGGVLMPEDRIPQRIYFDMNQPPPPQPMYVPYPYPVYSPYYDPFYYPYYGPRWYGPSLSFGFSGGSYYHHGGHGDWHGGHGGGGHGGGGHGGGGHGGGGHH